MIDDDTRFSLFVFIQPADRLWELDRCDDASTFLSLVANPFAINMQYKNSSAKQPSSRNPLLWPFASDSIWNTPIGSKAKYVDAQINTSPVLTTDVDHFYVLNDDDPGRSVIRYGGWGDRDSGTKDLGYDLNLPDELLIPDAKRPHTPNNAVAFLMPDGENIAQFNATARSKLGGKLYGTANTPDANLYGSGELGGHGGSGMSSIGGTIRLGELTNDEPIRHALKMNLWAEKYLSYASGPGGGKGYRWPAIRSDSYANSQRYGGKVSALTMGGLLAIPPNVTPESLGLKSKPAIKMFHALQDYGAYVVDDTAWNAHAIETENGVQQEFAAEYGHRFGDKNSQFFKDVMKMFTSLHVVANNGKNSVGGGGEPRVPVAPPIDTSHVKDLQKLQDTVEDTFRADFNGDGKKDILWRNLATGLNQVWLQDSNGKPVGGGNIQPLTDPDWQIKSTPDVDKDGKAEIVWENRTTGAQQTWHLDNLRVSGGIDGHGWMNTRDGLPRITFSKGSGKPVSAPEPVETPVDKEPDPISEGDKTPDPVSEGDKVPVPNPSEGDKTPNPVSEGDKNPDPNPSEGDKTPHPDSEGDKNPAPNPSEDKVPNPAPGSEKVVGEYDTLQLNDKWQTVSLDNSYDNPVVIVSDPTLEGADPAVVRIQNVTDKTFQLRLQEPRYKGGQHKNEKVSYVVMEAGDWELDSGARISAGTHETDRLTSSGFDVVGLEGFEDTPTVLSQVQSSNGGDWVTTRMTQQSKNGFQLAMQEEEAFNKGGHVDETIGWLALDPGVGSDGDTLLQGGTTGRDFDSDRSTVQFEKAFDAAPSVIAKLGSFYGADTANLRLDSISNISFGARVHEEQSLDKEMGHIDETVAFLALEGTSGTLTGSSV